jgi:hypothetical protein
VLREVLERKSTIRNVFSPSGYSFGSQMAKYSYAIYVLVILRVLDTSVKVFFPPHMNSYSHSLLTHESIE